MRSLGQGQTSTSRSWSILRPDRPGQQPSDALNPPNALTTPAVRAEIAQSGELSMATRFDKRWSVPCARSGISAPCGSKRLSQRLTTIRCSRAGRHVSMCARAPRRGLRPTVTGRPPVREQSASMAGARRSAMSASGISSRNSSGCAFTAVLPRAVVQSPTEDAFAAELVGVLPLFCDQIRETWTCSMPLEPASLLVQSCEGA